MPIHYRYFIDTLTLLSRFNIFMHRYTIDNVSIHYRYCIDTISIRYHYYIISCFSCLAILALLAVSLFHLLVFLLCLSLLVLPFFLVFLSGFPFGITSLTILSNSLPAMIPHDSLWLIQGRASSHSSCRSDVAPIYEVSELNHRPTEAL